VLATFAFVLLVPARPAAAYSVLTHQALVDAAWGDSIEPLLRRRFPGATPAALRQARAHAYGGSILQDLGYYPLGSRLFTDLLHYARSGHFVEALLDEARTLDEYAFALGALAHYAADVYGHPAINRATPMVYPKLRRRYGDVVTYGDAPAAHLKTEFGFDVIQTARGHYASETYHDFIGFEVAKPVLERTFLRVYGIEADDLFTSFDLAIGTYRRSVSDVIPQMTRVAWETRKDEIERLFPNTRREQFVFNLTRRQFEAKWGTRYERPGFFAKLLAFVLRILPKIGLFRPLAFCAPTPEAQRLFESSFAATLADYRKLLAAVRAGKLELRDVDYDTGRPTSAGEYPLADRAWAKLLEKLDERKFRGVSPELARDLTAFFAGAQSNGLLTKDPKLRRKTEAALARLKTAGASEPGVRAPK
jgi:hypothetical protein